MLEPLRTIAKVQVTCDVDKRSELALLIFNNGEVQFNTDDDEIYIDNLDKLIALRDGLDEAIGILTTRRE